MVLNLRLGFLSVADAAPSSGEIFCLMASSGRMVMQLTGVFMVGGSNPGRANMALPPPPTADDSRLTRIRTADLKSCSRPRYHSTGVWCYSCIPPHCLEPSERKLLTPRTPHTPPLKKVISSFRG